jgi:tol-pal system beta propeller repeat protein TolB
MIDSLTRRRWQGRFGLLGLAAAVLACQPFSRLGPATEPIPLFVPTGTFTPGGPKKTATTILEPTVTTGPASLPALTPTPWTDDPPQGHIVYVCFLNGYDNLCLMNADGSADQRLTETRATDFYPSLSATGRQILFSTRRDNNFEIYSLAIDGTNPHRLTENAGSNYAPALSPDGSKIVYTSVRGTASNIWTMNPDGSGQTPLTDSGQDIDPAWSPDGTQISFGSNRGGTVELYVMKADGSDVRQVTHGLAIGGRNDWSPDGKRLTFYAGPTNGHTIYLVNLDGTGLQALTGGSDNRGPSFSPDGNWIAFTSFRDGNNEIYIMHPDGARQTRLTNNTRPDWQPRWGP